jgi:hypothetical protein
VIEEAQIVVHEGHQPDFLGDLPNAYILPGERATEVDLATSEADATAARDGDGAIVEGIFELGAGSDWQSP